MSKCYKVTYTPTAISTPLPRLKIILRMGLFLWSFDRILKQIKKKKKTKEIYKKMINNKNKGKSQKMWRKKNVNIFFNKLRVA